jgi:hypothetical protein
MTPPPDAQRALARAEITWAETLTALETAQTEAWALNQAWLLPAGLAAEASAAISDACEALKDLIAAVSAS